MFAIPRLLLRLLLTDRAALPVALRSVGLATRFGVRNRLSRESVVGDVDVDVCVTTFGSRTASAYLALESIGAGSTRPRRLILWIDEPDVLANPPATLRRLRRRGLEIAACENWGPHKKQYPYVVAPGAGTSPFATADDDTFYPASWLAELVESHRDDPTVVHGHRAHRIVAEGGAIAPYSRWVAETTDRPGFATLCTGVGGIIYPAPMVTALREAGTRFLDVAPTADDLWVHAVAVGSGIRSAQVGTVSRDYPQILRRAVGSLFSKNVAGGGNDRQIARALTGVALARVLGDADERMLHG
ncbi:glycosyl transferase [Isoptericola hypogeus]|uniref:Glycosyl transferase n=1 Tax=Isoptericola hypogeus TaxID=300179 RepID=A0ABN2JM32_9MICO